MANIPVMFRWQSAEREALDVSSGRIHQQSKVIVGLRNVLNLPYFTLKSFIEFFEQHFEFQ